MSSWIGDKKIPAEIKAAVWDYMDSVEFMGPEEVRESRIDDLEFWIKASDTPAEYRALYEEEMLELTDGLEAGFAYEEMTQADHWGYRQEIGDNSPLFCDLYMFMQLGEDWELERRKGV